MMEIAFKIFDSYDADNTGFLEPAEFKKVIK